MNFDFSFHFRMTSRPRTTSFVDPQKSSNTNNFGGMKISSKDGSKVMTVIASPGQGPDRSTEVSYTDTKVSLTPCHGCTFFEKNIQIPMLIFLCKSVTYCQVHVLFFTEQVIGNGSFGVVYQAKLCDSGEMVAIKKVLQDKRWVIESFRQNKN